MDIGLYREDIAGRRLRDRSGDIDVLKGDAHTRWWVENRSQIRVIVVNELLVSGLRFGDVVITANVVAAWELVRLDRSARRLGFLETAIGLEG